VQCALSGVTFRHLCRIAPQRRLRIEFPSWSYERVLRFEDSQADGLFDCSVELLADAREGSAISRSIGGEYFCQRRSAAR